MSVKNLVGAKKDNASKGEVEIKNPERYHHGNLKESLVQMGLEILVKEGVESLTLREVARRVGVSHAAPYRHFADKNELIVAIADEGFTLLDEKLEETLKKNALRDTGAQITELAWTYVKFTFHHRSYMKVMFGSYVTDFTKYPGMEAKITRGRDLLESVILEGQKIKKLRDNDLRLMALSCWSMVHGVAMLLVERRSEINDYSESQLETFCRALMSNLLSGLLRS
jgi:AcrR family transcriptional regulator